MYIYTNSIINIKYTLLSKKIKFPQEKIPQEIPVNNENKEITIPKTEFIFNILIQIFNLVTKCNRIIIIVIIYKRKLYVDIVECK